MYTTSTAFLEALGEAGITHLFANLGSDHPGLIEAMAEARAHDRDLPMLVTCPNEMVGMSAAQGFAQVSGRAQAVLVHVECGTQALAGAVHNAAKGRVPMLVYAGASPFTQEGELFGTRNEFIQWLQDVFDQRGLVRGYMRYDNEIRTGRNVKQIVHRAMQFANSMPKGPVYLMGAREVMEEEIPRTEVNPADWQPIVPAALPDETAMAIAADLAVATRPLVVTSYLGRNVAAVAALIALCRSYGIGVLESVPSYVNYPTDDPLHQGSQWSQPVQNRALAKADVVLVLDSDVPWIPSVSRPADGAVVHHIDVDPLKQQMPLWSIPARTVAQADARTALKQIARHLEDQDVDTALIAERKAHYAAAHAARQRDIDQREARPADAITPEWLTACMRERLEDDALVLNEGITNYAAITDHLKRTRPGSMIASGGGSLGWNGGAAIGAKMAAPDRTVVALCGDGSYMFSVPSVVHWMARRYKTPFLQVVYNNGGWNGPKFSTLAIHPDGYASRAEELGIAFDPPPDHAGIAAAAGGAFATTVKTPAALEPALNAAFRAVREEGRAAVVDVWLPHL